MKQLSILLAALVLAGCAATQSGTGPTSSIDGVDIYRNSTPTRSYNVMATVARQGADSSSSYDDEIQLIAQDAKARGADAVIVQTTVMVPSRMRLLTNTAVMAPKVIAELIQYQ
jgi:PBP1b-binding outer membrane lipoprotein LpoB